MNQGFKDNYKFFTPTKRLRQYFLLETIASEEGHSQRDLSQAAGISPSVTNKYLREFEEEDLIKRERVNKRDFDYSLTAKGERERKELMVSYIRETFQLFSAGKGELAQVLEEYSRERGWEDVVFYTAGEVTELLIHSLEDTELKLRAIVDDDQEKQGKTLFGYPVIPAERITDYEPDGVIITTFRYREEIRQRVEGLEEEGIPVVGL